MPEQLIYIKRVKHKLITCQQTNQQCQLIRAELVQLGGDEKQEIERCEINKLKKYCFKKNWNDE